jgi:hypothetical protein
VPGKVGKTTLVQQVTEEFATPVRFASADEPTLRGADWISQQWEAARLSSGPEGAILVLDEVQKALGWSESVKRLWDEDTRAKPPIKLILLGSAPLLALPFRSGASDTSPECHNWACSESALYSLTIVALRGTLTFLRRNYGADGTHSKGD